MTPSSYFKSIIGNQNICSYLIASYKNQRVAHAQILNGTSGYGTLPMALAYAKMLVNYKAPERQNPEKQNWVFHPDLHFVYPVTTTKEIKKNPTSDLFLNQWQEFIQEQPYSGLSDWCKHIGSENKQGLIGVTEALNIAKKLSLKSHSGSYKVMLIWNAEQLNVSASNKLLKLIEEPPLKTIFLLVTSDQNKLLNTIRSRCQSTNLKPIDTESMTTYLQNKHQLELQSAMQIASQSQGDYNTALKYLIKHESTDIFETWFITWVRLAFKAAKQKSTISELLQWSENISTKPREMQKDFLEYCSKTFRDSLLINYKVPQLVYKTPDKENFKLENFAPFIHSGNIENIFKTLEQAQVHLERNANSKIIFTDLCLQLTKLLHTKES